MIFNLSNPTCFVSPSPPLLATPLKCANGKFRDVSSAPVPRCSSQLLPPGQENIYSLTRSIRGVAKLFSHHLCARRLVLTWFMCLPDPPGKRHHPTPCGSKGRPDPAGWATSGVRGRPRCTRHQWTHTNGLRKVPKAEIQSAVGDLWVEPIKMEIHTHFFLALSSCIIDAVVAKTALATWLLSKTNVRIPSEGRVVNSGSNSQVFYLLNSSCFVSALADVLPLCHKPTFFFKTCSRTVW